MESSDELKSNSRSGISAKKHWQDWTLVILLLLLHISVAASRSAKSSQNHYACSAKGPVYPLFLWFICSIIVSSCSLLIQESQFSGK